jgi:hypothetical protein
MRSKLVIKLLTSAAFGALLGQYVQADHEKWHKLGRDAFLSFQGHRFDLNMANPGSGLNYLIGGSLTVVGLCAVYEVIAIVGTMLVALVHREKPRAEVN